MTPADSAALAAAHHKRDRRAARRLARAAARGETLTPAPPSDLVEQLGARGLSLDALAVVRSTLGLPPLEALNRAEQRELLLWVDEDPAVQGYIAAVQDALDDAGLTVVTTAADGIVHVVHPARSS